ncbi:M1 family aminopeptidase [Candidatus Neomarinimicrobiota bacterium]
MPSITFFYHGDLIGLHESGWHYIKAPHFWYPRYQLDRRGNQNATYDLTFRVPKALDLVSVGKRRSMKTTDKKAVVSQWIIDKPVNHATFSVGNYKEYKIEDPRIPGVKVLRAGTGLGSSKKMQKDVAADVANSIALYQHVFGPAPFEELAAIEIPYLYGEAFHGLVQLSAITFQFSGQFSETFGFNEYFRAHEVAHQWWGVGVDFKTYHDQWLSEGLATFSGLWYMRVILKDNDLYFGFLDEWRKEILTNRKYLFVDGQESGPVWLGYRTSSSTTEGDYSLIIYRKGAWVMHMLRTMMIDLNTMNEDAFTNMLREFYTVYKDGRASTEDFQRIVEKHMQADMDWFFKQWIYGTDIPEYHFTWSTQPLAEDRYLFKCRIEQSGISGTFRAHIPISLDFGNNKRAGFRVWVEDSVTEQQMMLPQEPQEVTFNYLESVLCSIKK